MLVFFVCFGWASFSQPGEWATKNKKAIKYAEQALSASNFLLKETGQPDWPTAIFWCDKAIEKDPEFSDAYLLKADFEMSLGKNKEAIATLNKMLALPTFTSETGYVYFDLAMLEMSEALYADALKHANIYIKLPGANPEWKREAEWWIVNCEFAMDAMAHPVEFKPVNVGAGVNTFEPEYFPTLTVDQTQMLFTRHIGRTDYKPGQEDFFISTSKNGYWDAGVPMPRNINTPYNEGAPTFAPDGRTLIFVGCEEPGSGYGEGRRGYGSCDLFITERVGGKWLDPINLPGSVNSQHWETQPSLSSDGQTLYFIRGNMKNFGGRELRRADIYYSKKQEDGSWGPGVKMPDHINTPFSESSVLIHPDGKTLYFSSNGHIGMGGDDLYVTRLQPDGIWSKPQNLGYPINTPGNENSLLVFANGEIAIFGSDRPGGLGELDLYEFRMPESIRPTRTIYMTGTVFDSKTNAKLEAEFSLVDLETGLEVVHSFSDRVDGSFLVSLPVNKEYGLFVKRDGYYNFSRNFNLTVPENSNDPYHEDVPLVPNNVTDTFTLANVFFDLDSDRLKIQSNVELDNFAQVLRDRSTMKVELQGHTDTQGDDTHNLDLSNRRAKAVYDYLVAKGIANERLTWKGFGETKPVVSDAAIAAMKTEKEKQAAHQENRRTVYLVKAL